MYEIFSLKIVNCNNTKTSILLNKEKPKNCQFIVL